MQRLVYALVLGGVFLLGVWVGDRQSENGRSLASEPLTLDKVLRQSRSPDAFSQAQANQDWEAIVALLEAARSLPDPTEFQSLYQRLLELARELAAAEAAGEAAELMSLYVELNPHDEVALFLLSDLYVVDGQYESALQPLVQILQFPPSDEVRAQARANLDAITDDAIEPMIVEEDIDGLIGFYQHLVELEPGYDGHRLEVVRWHTRAGDLERAQELLREVGSVGVSSEALEDVEQEIELQSVGVAFQREGEAIYADAFTGDQTVKLLVDTGATRTVIARSTIGFLDAESANLVARVNTAGGIVEADVYRLASFQIGPVEMTDFEVLVLEDVPDSSDGLLGLDVLDKLGAEVSIN